MHEGACTRGACTGARAHVEAMQQGYGGTCIRGHEATAGALHIVMDAQRRTPTRVRSDRALADVVDDAVGVHVQEQEGAGAGAAGGAHHLYAPVGGGQRSGACGAGQRCTQDGGGTAPFQVQLFQELHHACKAEELGC